MTIIERRVGDVTILELNGRLVFDDGDVVLRSRVNKLVDEGRVNIVLDLRNVIYVDSCGVGVLIAKYVSARRKGGDMKLMHLSPRCQRVMAISKLLGVFETFGSESDAVASFTDQPGRS